MKKTGILLLTAVLVMGTVGCGTSKKAGDKETIKKEVVEKESVEDTVETDVEEETGEETKVEVTGSGGETVDTQANTPQSTTKNGTNNNKNNTSSTTNKTSPTGASQTVTLPTTGHVHNWTEVKTQVVVPETGHYEKVQGWVKFCDVCNVNMDDWTNEEIDAHTFGDECPGKFTMDCKNIGEKWVVDTPATTEERVTGYKCSCGATREKTQYAGMYSVYDQASWDRLEACKRFFAKGLAGADSDVYKNSIQYGNWESVVVCNGSTNGAWMWVFIRDWKLDNYDYLKDTVAQGIIDQEEADLVKALYEEIPSIFKGAIECIAPQGGTEVYNYVVKLINQANGNLVEVPNLSGAKGLIPENIPGLYVTIEETRGGFSLMFWAE